MRRLSPLPTTWALLLLAFKSPRRRVTNSLTLTPELCSAKTMARSRFQAKVRRLRARVLTLEGDHATERGEHPRAAAFLSAALETEPTAPRTAFRVIGPGYLETVGIPLLRGRDFTKRDSGETPPDPLAAKRFSGKFVVRVPPDVHRRLATEAAEEGVSLNRLDPSDLRRHIAMKILRHPANSGWKQPVTRRGEPAAYRLRPSPTSTWPPARFRGRT